MEYLNCGLSIDIKRSDGRIHGAKITSISKDEECVTVEWIESGETKGKEVDLASIIDINRKLFQRSAKSVNVPDDDVVSVRSNFNNGSAASKKRTPITRQGSVSEIRSMRRQVTKNGKEGYLNRVMSKVKIEPVAVKNDKKRAVASNVVGRKSLYKNKPLRNSKVTSVVNDPPDFGPPVPITGFKGMIDEYINNMNIMPLSYLNLPLDQKITVCIRKRPLNKKELTRNEIQVITMSNDHTLLVHEPKTKVDQTKYLDNQKFNFDYVFNEEADNYLIYNYTAKPLLNVLFSGGAATCFAYGQTGSGKTHTMNGKFNRKTQKFEENGIYTYAAQDLFEWLSEAPQCNNYMAGGAYFEIYGGKVFDLLNNRNKLRILEDGKGCIQLIGLKETYIQSACDVTNLIELGSRIRTSGQTSANVNSSRSHAIFQLILRHRNSRKLYGVFSLIDLAGNERGADTMNSDRQTRLEGAEINKSLLSLKECIRALGKKSNHVPFRGSKLTLVLRDSFIGEKSKTCMIASVSPGLTSCEHTLNTLRYANRVKELGPEDAEFIEIVDDQEIIMQEPNNSFSENLINQFFTLEERVHEYHSDFIECSREKLNQLQKVMEMTDIINYNVNDYCTKIEDFIQEQAAMMNEFSDRVDALKSKNEEELTNNKTQRK